MKQVVVLLQADAEFRYFKERALTIISRFFEKNKKI